MPAKITNADRVIFPDDGITKGDVVAYYALVADRMLPFHHRSGPHRGAVPQGNRRQGLHAEERPQSLSGEHHRSS